MVSRTIAITVLTMAAAGAASAQQTTYDYTGAPMSGVVFGSNIGPGGDFGQYQYCCTTFDSSMTLSAPLAPNLNNAVVDPTAFTFGFTTIGGPIGAPPGSSPGGAISDLRGGPQVSGGLYAGDLSNYNTWVQTNIGGAITAPAPGNSITAGTGQFVVSTNSAGQITSWNLVGETVEPATVVYWTGKLSSSTGDSLDFNTFNHGPDYTLSNSTPGSWSAVGTNSVPEIDAGSAGAALTLLLGSMAILRGRRRSMTKL